MNGEPRGYQHRLSGLQCKRRIQTGTQIQACRTRSSVLRQLIAHARIEDSDIKLLQVVLGEC